MQVIKVKGTVGTDGMLNLSIPNLIAGQLIDVVIIVEADSTAVDPTLSKPKRVTQAFFDELDKIEADDMVEEPYDPPPIPVKVI